MYNWMQVYEKYKCKRDNRFEHTVGRLIQEFQEESIWYFQVQRIVVVNKMSCGGYSFVEILFSYLFQMGMVASYLIERVEVKVFIETDDMIGWSGSLFLIFGVTRFVIISHINRPFLLFNRL